MTPSPRSSARPATGSTCPGPSWSTWSPQWWVSVGQGPAQEQHQAAEAGVHHGLLQSTMVLRSTLVSGEAWEADLHVEW